MEWTYRQRKSIEEEEEEEQEQEEEEQEEQEQEEEEEEGWRRRIHTPRCFPWAGRVKQRNSFTDR